MRAFTLRLVFRRKKPLNDRLNKISQMGCFCCGLPANINKIISEQPLTSRYINKQYTLCPYTHTRSSKDDVVNDG